MSWIDMSPNQSSAQVAAVVSRSMGAEDSSSKRATTAADEMMGLEVDSDGDSRSTSLTKKEC
jgi:hypothetical protein